jgi:hypothetical protein
MAVSGKQNSLSRVRSWRMCSVTRTWINGVSRPSSTISSCLTTRPTISCRSRPRRNLREVPFTPKIVVAKKPYSQLDIPKYVFDTKMRKINVSIKRSFDTFGSTHNSVNSTKKLETVQQSRSSQSSL